MFNKKDFYLYDGLYFDQDTFDKAGLIKKNGFDLMISLQSFEEVYKLEDGKLVKLDKKNVIDSIGVSDYRDREFCYLVKNSKLIIFPIEIYYGIENKGGLLAFFSNKDYRDFMFNQVSCVGFNVEFIETMAKSRNVIDKYNKQQQLIKTYNNLNNMGRSN